MTNETITGTRRMAARLIALAAVAFSRSQRSNHDFFDHRSIHTHPEH
jgi:hypothetical protein